MRDPEIIRRLISHSESRIILKYIAAGCLSIGVNFATFMFGVWLDLDHFIAAVAGYATGLLSSFVLGYLFVFTPRRNAARRPFIFIVLSFLLVYGLGGLLMGIGVDYGVETRGFPSAPTWVVVAAFVVAWNYLGSRFLVFRGGL